MWIETLLALLAGHEPEPALRVLRGSVVVSDADGRALEWTSGTLVLSVSGERRGSRPVRFRDGSFDLRVDRRATWIEAHGAWTVLGPARIDASDVYIPENGVLLLEARLVAPITLQVLDAETATPLDCVDIVPPPCLKSACEYLSALDGSAIELGPLFGETWLGSRGDGTWIARAPGRVEGRVELTHNSPRSIVVHLERAGRLELLLVNAPSTRHTYLELESGDIGLVSRGRIDPRSPPRFEGLKPGPYVARVVHEFLDYSRVVLAEARVDVLPDVIISTKLLVAEPPPDDTDGPWEPID